MWRQIGIGCGGLVVLLFLVLILGIIISGGNQAGQKTTATTQASPPPARNRERRLPRDKHRKKARRRVLRFGLAASLPGRLSVAPTVSSSQQSVDGYAPQEYQGPIKSGFMQFDAVSATFQKRGQDSSQLTVEIIADGRVKKQGTTSAQFGVVSVNWNTSE